jgi:hypothetical protein
MTQTNVALQDELTSDFQRPRAQVPLVQRTLFRLAIRSDSSQEKTRFPQSSLQGRVLGTLTLFVDVLELQTHY